MAFYWKAMAVLLKSHGRRGVRMLQKLTEAQAQRRCLNLPSGPRGSCTAEASSDSGKLVRWYDNTCMVLMLFYLLVAVFFLQRNVCCPWTQGMLTLELSSIVLEIPNDAYETQSKSDWLCSTLSQECGNLIGWYWKLMRRSSWTLTRPFGGEIIEINIKWKHLFPFFEIKNH